MSRTSQIVTIVLLAAIVAVGGLLVARRQAESGSSVAPTSAGVVVYAPCGMSSPIAIATQRFREANPDVKINVVFDNSIVLVRKIRAGDRPDIFISPGELEMKQLTEEGYIDGSTTKDFGTMDIVIIAPSKTKSLKTIAGLTAPEIKQISMADPKLNSVGWYAQQAFEKMGLWEPLQSKLLPREYPLEAVTLATTGKVDAAVAFLTCPLETAPDKADATDVHIVEAFPRDAYPPVRLQVAALKESRKKDLCQRYIDFMTSEEGQKAVATNGILPAKEIQ